MSGAATAFAGVGFVRGLLGPPTIQRMIVFPAQNSDGTPQVNADDQQLFYAIDGYVAIAEEHHDEMIITDHPVEQGSTISDHAYRVPSRLSCRLAWSAAMSNAGVLSAFNVTLPTIAGLFGIFGTAGSDFLRSTYQQLLQIMQNRELLTIYTGKRTYENMLIQSIQERTTEETENSLLLEVRFREVILVSTSTVTVKSYSNDDQWDLGASGPTSERGQQNLKDGSNFNDDVPFVDAGFSSLG